MVAVGAGPVSLVGLSGSRWTIAPPVASHLWSDLPHLSPIMVQLLVNRSIMLDEADVFLQAGADLGHSPFLLRGMDAAVARIRRAIAAREHIVVYGDFDVDGVTACAVMTLTLEALGAVCRSYIPHRNVEGYGLNAATLAGFVAEGVRLSLQLIAAAAVWRK